MNNSQVKSLCICFVGDSFVNGTGDPECLGWVGRICAAAQQQGHDITCYNLGIRRDTSAAIARRWRNEVLLRLPPEYEGRLVFSFGVNDTSLEDGSTRVAFDASVENARSILSQARQLCPTLMVGPPPIADEAQNTRIARLSEALGLVCADLAVPYLDVFAPLWQSTTWMSEVAAHDGAHPRSAGYALFVRLVQGWSAWEAWFG